MRVFTPESNHSKIRRVCGGADAVFFGTNGGGSRNGVGERFARGLRRRFPPIKTSPGFPGFRGGGFPWWGRFSLRGGSSKPTGAHSPPGAETPPNKNPPPAAPRGPGGPPPPPRPPTPPGRGPPPPPPPNPPPFRPEPRAPPQTRLILE